MGPGAVLDLRGVLVALDAGRGPELARACFEAYWGRDEDLAQDSVLRAIAAGQGFDPDAFMEATSSPEIKQRLRANTEELIDRGGFGSPTIFVNCDDIYFGNDRMPLVEAALAALD